MSSKPCEACGKPTKNKRLCSRACNGFLVTTRAKRLRARPEPPAVDGARWVPLDDGFALVDERDYEEVSAHVWHVAQRGGQTYARNSEMAYLHTFIQPDLLEVDHHNGDTLDNRRDNLREGVGRANRQNRHKSAGVSRFKGVCPWRGRWRANIRIAISNGRGRQTHLGVFDSEEAAAHAYDVAARKHFGEFACLNFPEEGEQPALRST